MLVSTVRRFIREELWPLEDAVEQDGALDPAVNDEGWFATRDRGYFDDQQALVVEGRLDNVFISGGENIQPESIEQRLVDYPGVAQALVVAVPHPEWEIGRASCRERV